MKRTTVTLTILTGLLIATATLSGQVFPLSAIDSLKEVVTAEATTDSHRVMILHEIAWVYVNKDNDQAQLYADSAYVLGHSIAFEDGIRRSAHILANLSNLEGNHQETEKYAREARLIAIAHGDTNNIVRHGSLLASALWKTGREEESLTLFRESLDQAIKIRDTITIIPLQFNYYLKLKSQGKAEEGARLLVRLLDYPLSFYQATLILENVCDSYLNINMSDKGLPYCYQAVRIADFEKNKQGYYRIHQLLGQHFYEAQQLDSARKYFQIILDTRRKSTDYAQALVNVANVDMAEDKIGAAWNKVIEAMIIYDEAGRDDLKTGAILLRADLNAKREDFTESIADYEEVLSADLGAKYRMAVLEKSIRIQMRAKKKVHEDRFTEFNHLRDSLHGTTLEDNAAKVVEEFENDRLRAREEVLKQKAKVTQLTLERQRYGIGLIGVTALALLAAFFFQRRSKRREAALNTDLLVKNKEITQQNTYISRLNTNIHHTTGNYLSRIIHLLRAQRRRGVRDKMDVQVTDSLERQTTAFRRLQQQPTRENYYIDIAPYLKAYCRDLEGSFSGGETPLLINCNAESLEVPVSFAGDIGLILQELTTNSVKYARKEGQKVVVWLDTINEEVDKLRIIYRDGGPNDGEINPAIYTSNLGMVLIKDLTSDRKGKLVRYGTDDSFDYEATFSLAHQSLPHAAT